MERGAVVATRCRRPGPAATGRALPCRQDISQLGAEQQPQPAAVVV